MHTCRARRACHPEEPISKCLLRKLRVLYTEPWFSSFDAGPEPVLHLIGGQPTFQPSRASGPSPAHPDYVMFVQRPDLSKTAPLSRTTSERRHAGRMQLLGAPVDRPKQAWFGRVPVDRLPLGRSEEHTSELQSLMRISYAVFCLKKKNKQQTQSQIISANITTNR